MKLGEMATCFMLARLSKESGNGCIIINRGVSSMPVIGKAIVLLILTTKIIHQMNTEIRRIALSPARPDRSLPPRRGGAGVHFLE